MRKLLKKLSVRQQQRIRRELHESTINKAVAVINDNVEKTMSHDNLSDIDTIRASESNL